MRDFMEIWLVRRIWHSLRCCRECSNSEYQIQSRTRADICWVPFGSGVRKRTHRDGIRTSEPGNQGLM